MRNQEMMREAAKMFKKLLGKLLARDEAATMIEYSLMLGLIAAVCLAAVTLLGTNTQAFFNAIAGSL